MNKNNNLPTNWKKTIEQSNMGTNPAEILPILQELIRERDVEEIQWFYQHICTDTISRNDRDESFDNFINWFSNMKPYVDIKANKEPKTSNHYLCFRCIYHRGEDDEFYVDTFFKKKEFFEAPYRYHQFLMYNNLAGMETFLHTNEFEEPIFEENKMVQCNNIVLTFKWERTKYEKLLNPPIYLSWNWYEEIKDKFEELGLNFRNVLSNGEDLIVVLDLQRTINLKNKSLRFVLEEVKNKLQEELKEFYIYNNQDFFMVPGSINIQHKVGTADMKNSMFFPARTIIDNCLIPNEFSYRKCYMLGDDYFNTGTISLTSLANYFHMEKKETEELNTKKHKNNFVRFKKVGEERLSDFDTLLLYRNFKIEDNFTFMSIMANVLFYLNRKDEDIMCYLQEKNALLCNPLNSYQLKSIFDFNKKNFEIYKNNPNSGIKYTNDKIVKKLSITEDEQDKMLQLISKETAELRTLYHKREYAKKRYEKKKLENKEKKEKFQEEVWNLYNSGLTKKEIAEKLGKDIRTIKKVLEDTEGEALLLVKKYYSFGLSVQEISERFRISQRKVKKALREKEEIKEKEAGNLPPSFSIRKVPANSTNNNSQNSKSPIHNKACSLDSKEGLNEISNDNCYKCQNKIDDKREKEMVVLQNIRTCSKNCNNCIKDSIRNEIHQECKIIPCHLLVDS